MFVDGSNAYCTGRGALRATTFDNAKALPIDKCQSLRGSKQ